VSPGGTPPLRGFHPLSVLDVVRETADARSFVLSVPAGLEPHFAYRAGQYLTFRLPVGPEPVLRCYSMSSAPGLGEPLRTTVKRVPGGVGSGWLLDHVQPGDVLEATVPAGTFLLPDEPWPVVAFAAGSGITPVLSIVKAALATTTRPVRLLYANRDRASVILGAELDTLVAAHPERLTVAHHLDDTDGLVTADDVVAHLGADHRGHVLLCGPTPFMDLVEAGLGAAGVAPERILSERFVQPDPVAAAPAGPVTGSVVVTIGGRTHELPHHPGETILETARRGGLNPPFSCQAGNCGTCIARVTEGAATMRVNEALYPDEVADGYVLTCQGVPTTRLVRVAYEA
jgi:3-ketosteroid 9alpha-monooxygenase subunit B